MLIAICHANMADTRALLRNKCALRCARGVRLSACLPCICSAHMGVRAQHRCTPASVVSTLEAVNMVLGGGKILVVVGE